MSREEMIRRGLEALEAAKKRSPEEGFQWMIDQGLIDVNGDVIFVHDDKQKQEKQEEKQDHEPSTSR